MRLLRGFARFWWDFIVGDEWRIAIIVAAATALGVLAAVGGGLDGRAIACGIGVGVMLAVFVAIVTPHYRSRD